ncbi:sugar ABC transporter permease [Treponema sp. OMZ 840]|uniref:carbohydrate ABC transporter permease n=1 Tax=Treponema sp. OMZ 840 TaxID=244313 RepID=UPI003D8B4CA6
MKGIGIPPRTKDRLQDFLCTVPALILILVFTYYPIAKLIQISFTNWNLLNDNYQYVGFKNWKWLFTGSGTRYLLNSLRATFVFSAGSLFITIVGGLILALIFNTMKKGFSVMRAVVFMPKYVAMSSAAVVFLWILDSDYGVLNYIISRIGMQPVDWLGKRGTAMLSVLMLTGWRDIGYGMIVYLASMRSIPKDYYEAAAIDGATYWQRLFRITLPMLSPTTLFLFVTQFIASMKVFQSIDIMTAGGPYRSTEVFVYKIYQYAMEDFRMDRAAVMALAFFILLLVITVSTLKFSDRRVNYDM